jgi:hypothetical protein
MEIAGNNQIESGPQHAAASVLNLAEQPHLGKR